MGAHDNALSTLVDVLVDAERPEMDGYVLTQYIKRDPHFADIPVVMHLSLSSVAKRETAQQAGVDACFAKFNIESLAATIAGNLHPKAA